ncbi:nucleolar GTP-binding protein [Cyclospora cayetanensis]|uniref:Nucleolar GTP-binding protein 1 n=1 Tax=Cyclospora cayetanensis TaxID=88456 RepID=A0A1D3CSF6_9EIME|nr:nucleolar GTP-binding protein [Cyclospora cayetanensis]
MSPCSLGPGTPLLHAAIDSLVDGNKAYSLFMGLEYDKDLPPVLTAASLIDVCLSKTQRKTPTEIHKRSNINVIKKFYIRKIKTCAQFFIEKLKAIIVLFPKLDSVHPFYGDLLNILYDRDHYKLALGQVAACINRIERISKEYITLSKYSDSLYKSKSLKTAAFGRYCTVVKKLSKVFEYLEEVRMHLQRLPVIQTSARTLLLAGFPNVGKSSFVNHLSNANVEIIDTPGILDHPLEERNLIEMLAIAALTHLHCVVLFVIDVSEECGYSVAQQVALFKSIHVLFKNKPKVVILNKTDKVKPEDLELDAKQLLKQLETEADVSLSATSTLTAATATTYPGERLAGTGAKEGKQWARSGPPQGLLPPKQRLERDIEEEEGGPGVYSYDLRKKHILANEDWRYDVVPEIFDGKNVMDFVDPEIEQKLQALEREEEELLQKELEQQDEIQDQLTRLQSVRAKLSRLHRGISHKRMEAKLRKKKNGPRLLKKTTDDGVLQLRFASFVIIVPSEPRRGHTGEAEPLEEDAEQRQRLRTKIRRLTRSRSVADSARKREATTHNDGTLGGVPSGGEEEEDARLTSAVVLGQKKRLGGLSKEKAMQLKRSVDRKLRGTAGESDRFIQVKKVKWMMSGKRGIGKTHSR